MKAYQAGTASPAGVDFIDWFVPAPVPASRAASAERVTPQLLLVDDDPIFCRRVVRAAQAKNIHVTVCSSMERFTALRRALPFDVAILDYYFGDVTAKQVAHLLDKNTPVVVISSFGEHVVKSEGLPRATAAVLDKDSGIEKIIKTALAQSRKNSRGPALPEMELETAPFAFNWPAVLTFMGAVVILFQILSGL